MAGSRCSTNCLIGSGRCFLALRFNPKCGRPRAIWGFVVLGSSNSECRLWLIKSLIGRDGFCPRQADCLKLAIICGYFVGARARQARNWSLITSLASRFTVLTGAHILSGVAHPAFSEYLGPELVGAQIEVRHSLKASIARGRSPLCDSLGAEGCVRALARQTGQDPMLKATPGRSQ